MQHKENKEIRNLKVFGYGLSFILSFIAVRLWMKHGFSLSKAILLGVSFAFLVVTPLRLDWIKLVYTRWMKVAGVIGQIVTGFILAVVYYTVFTVGGIVLRIFKKDLLNRRLDPNAHSYWILRPETDLGKKHYEQQF